MQCVEELSPEACFDLDEIEAVPVFDVPDFMPDVPAVAFTFADTMTTSATACTYTVTLASENPYDGVFCFAQSPLGLRNWRKFWGSAAGLGANAVGAAVGYVAAETGVGVVLAVYCSANCGVQFGNMINALGDSDVHAPAGIVGALAENVQAIAGTDNDYVRYGTDIVDIGVPFVLSGRIDWSRLPTQSGTLFNLPSTALQYVPINPQVAYPFLTTVFQGADAGFGLYNSYNALQNEYWKLYQRDEQCK